VLAFFVVTFNPPKPEKNFDVTLPPPKPIESAEGAGEDVKLFESVTISLNAGAGGSLSAVYVEGQSVRMGNLVVELERVAGLLSTQESKLEAATIIADPTLKYRHVIEAVDACYRANIVKISFAAGAAPVP
jgi:biopolymer transport protein ExbD